MSFGDGDPVEQTQELRRRRGLPIGEEQMDGAQKGIDAVGFQARDRADPSRENPTQVVSDLARLVNPTSRGRQNRALRSSSSRARSLSLA